MRKACAMVFVVVCLCLPAGVATAQVQAGVKGGVAFSQAAWDGQDEWGWATNWAAGGFVSIPLGKQLFFQPEALYTRKGTRGEVGTSTFGYDVDYVEIPLLLRFSPATSGRVGFDLFGGLAPAVKTRAHYVFEDSSEGEREDLDVSEDVSSWDTGLVIGAGVHVGRFTTEVRWTEGLLNLDPEGIEKVRNRSIAVLAGFRF